MFRSRRTARLLTLVAGAGLALGVAAGPAAAWTLPGLPGGFDPCRLSQELCGPSVTLPPPPVVPDLPTIPDFPIAPCIINPEACQHPTTTTTAPPTTDTTVVTPTGDPDPEPDPGVPTAPTATPVDASPHFTG
jgi:hypothetical protein